MTATERLCELLDERGVEYVLDEDYADKYPPEQSVTWSCDIAGEDMTTTARDYCIGGNEYCLDLEFHEVFTPEQAVEATLGPTDPREHGLIPHFWTGDETLHIDPGKLPRRIDVTLPDPRGREVYSARVYRFEPERGDCKDDWAELGGFKCSECGHQAAILRNSNYSPNPYKYCPNCGRRVVDA